MRTLPQYWIVQNDDTQLFNQTVITYLNEKYRQYWKGDSPRGFYGYDGGSSYNGTNAHGAAEYFKNKPVLLTVAEFMSYFDASDFPRVDPKHFSQAFIFRPEVASFMIRVPKI